MKKLIAMILAAAMLLSLAACGSTAADAAADDPEAETASADASADTPPEKPDGTPPDGANGQPGTPPDGNPPDGAPNGQPGGFGVGGGDLLGIAQQRTGLYIAEMVAIVAVDGEFLRVGFGCSGHRVLSLWSIAKSTYPTV